MKRLLTLMSTVGLMSIMLAGPAAAEAMVAPHAPSAHPRADAPKARSDAPKAKTDSSKAKTDSSKGKTDSSSANYGTPGDQPPKHEPPKHEPPKHEPPKHHPKVQKAAVTPPAFAAGTCDATGSVVAIETAAYSWMISGTDSAKVYTAKAKAGYALTGQTSFTFDLRKIDAQSVDAEGECYVAPPVEEPVEVLGTGAVAPVAAPAPAASSPVLAFTGADGVVPMGIFGLIALALGAGLAAAAHRMARD